VTAPADDTPSNPRPGTPDDAAPATRAAAGQAGKKATKAVKKAAATPAAKAAATGSAPKKSSAVKKVPAAKAPVAKKAAPAAKAPAAKNVVSKKAPAAKAPAATVAASVSTPHTPERVHDVVIVGGGPAGSSCAYWLAEAGWDVVVVEKKHFPRVKTCGDGLTPRAVRQLADMGLEGALAGSHKYSGLRAYGFGQSIEMQWPEHPNFPNYGYTITRHDLDGLVAERAVTAGATLLAGTEVMAPIIAEAATSGSALPTLSGVSIKDKDSGSTRELLARYVVVADGANSRVGRMLGTTRNRDLPMGMALRGYYTSDRHDDPFIESHLDIRDAEGNIVPGYGWIFPMGDGRVNVGVGLLSTDRRWKGINTSHLMDAFVAWAPSSWGLSPETSLGPPTGGKLPMCLSVGPRAGGNVILAGDAAGTINPFNGEGIAYGYETGRLAAAALGHALTGEGASALADYDRQLEAAYGAYYKVARAFVRMISNPQAMKVCVGLGMRSEFVMTQLLRIMANLMRPDAAGPAEIGFRAMELVSRILPDNPGLSESPAA
jgi:geranylgeranyl reductase family protein